MSQKTVLISGTSTGIGAACAARQAAAGWKVYAGVRNEEDGERLAKATPGDVVPVLLDVTSNDDIRNVLAQIDKNDGSLDGLVNNAGVGIGGPVELLTEDQWRRQFDVNFFGLVNLTREAMGLVDKADGRFVHVGSLAGRIAAGGLGPYAASKHAVEAFNWALRNELRRNTKMTSSIVEPGEIKTDIWNKATTNTEDVERRLRERGLTERYGFLVDAGRGFIKEGQARGIDADKVAQAVEHALSAGRPKARYLVGADAKAGGALARLPDRALEKLMGLNQKRMERSGRS